MNTAHNAVTSSLEDRIIAKIKASGPIGIDDYMTACLSDAASGYYQHHDPFGVAGDFITAPEISGLFGEMCGFYLAHMFDLAKANSDAGMAGGELVELGPGRGTLMRDMHHVWQKLMPQMAEMPVNFVETSPALRTVQSATLKPVTPIWHDAVDTLPQTPIFGIANEFFDALPITQRVWRANSKNEVGQSGGWHHRLVGLVNDWPEMRQSTGTGADLSIERLGFVDGPRLDHVALAMHHAVLPEAPCDGSIAECCLAGDKILAQLAVRIAHHGGAMLIIDYGRDGNGQDSLQAVANHQPVDVFHAPGAADLSHWVDFAALQRSAAANGCRLIGPVEQGSFLMNVGLKTRAEQAGNNADPDMRRALLAAIDRLTNPAQMGAVFKVALLVPQGRGIPPGFEG